jgi:hypothetical protein
MARVVKIKDLDLNKVAFEGPSITYEQHKLYLNTGYITCPYGLQEDHLYLDAKYPDIYGGLSRVDQIDYLKVYYNDTVFIFDTNGERVEQPWYTLSMPFRACFLIEPILKGSTTVFWVKQIRLKQIMELPVGSIMRGVSD